MEGGVEKRKEYERRKKQWEKGIDRKFVRESIVAVWTTFVTIFNQYILKQISSDFADDKFT